MRITGRNVANGAMAGLLGATLLIALFFFIDLAQGEPLATPTFLSAALLGQDGLAVEPGPVRIALYTVAHYLVFIGLGILLAVLLEVADIPKHLLIGAAYGLLACSLVFYPALVLTGTDILAAPSWPVVFFGNVLAGVVMVVYLHWVSPEPGVTGVMSELMSHDTLREGLIVGLIGAGVVAVWFLIVDSIAGRPLFTPAALGSAILMGADAARAVEITWTTVLAYSFIHLAAFVLFGIASSALVTQAERYPPLVFGLILLFVTAETGFIFMVAMLGTWILEALAWWAILAGNVLSAVAMGVYLWRAHPAFRAELQDDVLWAPK